MRARRLVAVALAAGALAGCGGGDSGSGDPETWNHDPADTAAGPARWDELDTSYEACGEGTRQSPIDLGAAEKGGLPPVTLDYRAAPLVVENTGHTVEVPLPDGDDNTLTVGGDVYRLVQYHFHTPSEHTVDGTRYELEAHLVHEGMGGRLAVLAVFLSRSRPPNPLVSRVLEQAPEDAGEETEPGAQASPAALLPPSAGPDGLTLERYTTYSGSLTTPDCHEDVRWIVLTDPVGVDGEATRRLRDLVAEFPGYDGYERNNRPTQPLNGRAVTRDDG